MDVAHPGFTSCLWLSLEFWEQHSGTGNDSVPLFPFLLTRMCCLLDDKDEQCLGAVTQCSGQGLSGTSGEVTLNVLVLILLCATPHPCEDVT